MKIELDRIKLEAHVKWQQERYDEAFARVIDRVEGLVRDLKQIQNRKLIYTEALGCADGAGRAGQVISAMLQMMTNSQCYQLVTAAADLDATQYALLALQECRQGLPPEFVSIWEKKEQTEEAARLQKEQAEEANRAEKDRTQCHFKSRKGRCSRNGKIPISGKLYCKGHSTDPNVGKSSYTI